jgi:hypothetical protein
MKKKWYQKNFGGHSQEMVPKEFRWTLSQEIVPKEFWWTFSQEMVQKNVGGHSLKKFPLYENIFN